MLDSVFNNHIEILLTYQHQIVSINRLVRMKSGEQAAMAVNLIPLLHTLFTMPV